MTRLFARSRYLVREAWQSLRRHPGFVSSVVITMGVTTGALICVATLAYLLLFKPLPYDDQDRLYRVDHRLVTPQGNKAGPAFTFPGIMHLHENQDVFSETALISYGNDVISSLPHQPAVDIGYITPEWFSLFSASFVLGRGFEESEAPDTNNPVAVLSYATWKTDYGSDPDVLGKAVSFSGVDYRIVGVVSNAYVEPQILAAGASIGVWIPWDFNFGTKWRTIWAKFTSSLTFVGKLRDGISVSQAQQSVGTMVDTTWKANTAGMEFFNDHHIDIEFRSFRSLILGTSMSPVYLLLAAALGLVAIAAANISNLFMSRTAQQEQALAVRAAVGASKRSVFLALFAESAILMAMSGIVSLLIAVGGIRIIRSNLVTVLPRIDELSIDFFSFGMAILIAALLAALFARLSLGIIDFRALNSSLQSSGKGNAIQVSRRVRQMLIASQISIALALVFVNVSLFQAAYKTITLPLGYDVENVFYLSLSYAGRSRPPLDEVAPIMAEVRRKLLQLPGVKSLTQSRSPLGQGDFSRLLSRDGSNRLFAEAKGVDHHYFEFIGQTLLEGNYFSETDVKTKTGEESRFQVAIVNDVLAYSIDPDGSALGIAELPGFGTVNVVGVVKSVRRPGENEMPSRMFFPLHQGSTQLLVKMHDNQPLLRTQVGTLLRDIGDAWSVWDLHSLERRSQKMLFAQTATAITTAILTVLTCFLVGVGLYGVVSYSMQMRRFEVGIRMAVGAKSRDIVGMVLHENGRAILIGMLGCVAILLGLVAWLGENVKENITWQLLPTFLGTITLVSAVTMLTSYWPTRRYINKPVVNSLRSDN
jgi:predicted permease